MKNTSAYSARRSRPPQNMSATAIVATAPASTALATEAYKADVNVRVAWCGIGINLATNIPTPAALGNAVRTVLDTQNYRLRAARMADEFAAIDVRAEILRIVRQVVSS
jgi:UDP:flavonoid glycosyltransferase YjiC (YdhE family)